MSQVGGIEDELTIPEDLWSATIVNHCRGEHADAGVPMLIVIPGKKI